MANIVHFCLLLNSEGITCDVDMAQSKNKCKSNNLIFNLKKVLSHIAQAVEDEKRNYYKENTSVKIKIFFTKI